MARLCILLINLLRSNFQLSLPPLPIPQNDPKRPLLLPLVISPLRAVHFLHCTEETKRSINNKFGPQYFCDRSSPNCRWFYKWVILPTQQVNMTHSQIRTNVASPADKDGMFDCAEQVRLTEMQASGTLSRRRGTPLASISVSQICERLSIICLPQLVMRLYTFYGVGRTFTCIK